MKQRKYIIFSLLAFLLCIFFVPTLHAYLSDHEIIQNEISLGGVNLEIMEDFQPPQSLRPGISFQKKVSVKNRGPGECFLRIRVVVSDSDMEKQLSFDYNTEDYEKKEGYYYYKKCLFPGQCASELFHKVTIPENASEEVLKNFDIFILAEGCQGKNFENYFDAWKVMEQNKR
jgi:hypothetical protein